MKIIKIEDKHYNRDKHTKINTIRILTSDTLTQYLRVSATDSITIWYSDFVSRNSLAKDLEIELNNAYKEYCAQ